MAVGAVDSQVNEATAAEASPSLAEQWFRARNIELSIGAYYASLPGGSGSSTDGWAFGFSFETSTINPFSSGGGGPYFGIKVEWTSENGWPWYRFATPHDVTSHGFLIGADLQFNYAEGSGPWTGLFESVGGSLGIGSGSIFYSPGNGPGWRGYSVGLGLGPPGIGITQTDYVPW
jgi:hypothetical protein